MKFPIRTAIAAAFTAAFASVPTPAMAVPTTDGIVSPMAVCSPDGTSGPWYSFGSKRAIYLPDPSSRIYGDKGVTLSISKSTSFTIGGSVTGTATAEAGAVVAKASVSLAISISMSYTSTTTQAGSWEVPGPGAGWLEVGTLDGWQIPYEKYKFNSPCTKVVLASGTIKAPAGGARPYFKHS